VALAAPARICAGGRPESTDEGSSLPRQHELPSAPVCPVIDKTAAGQIVDDAFDQGDPRGVPFQTPAFAEGPGRGATTTNHYLRIGVRLHPTPREIHDRVRGANAGSRMSNP